VVDAINVQSSNSILLTYIFFSQQINKYPRTAIDLNILGLDYYKQLPGLYSNNRPIYTRIRGNLDTQLYLFYVDGYWLVGYDYTEARSVIIAEDDSSRPEHILGTWSIYTNGKIIAVNAKLKCRGLKWQSKPMISIEALR